MGIAVRSLFGEKRIGKVLPYLKLVGVLDLLFLNYSNAAIALPQAFAHPNFYFLGMVIVSTLSLCVCSFFAGWKIAKYHRSGLKDQASLMYGLGMNNNGSGLVLASTQLHAHPLVMLPIIFYNLEQQIIAGMVGEWLDRKALRIPPVAEPEFMPGLKTMFHLESETQSLGQAPTRTNINERPD